MIEEYRVEQCWMNKVGNFDYLWEYESCQGTFIIFLLESLNLLNISDEVLNFVELGKSFSWNQVAKVLFNLHCDLYAVKWIKSVVWEFAFFG